MIGLYGRVLAWSCPRSIIGTSTRVKGNSRRRSEISTAESPVSIVHAHFGGSRRARWCIIRCSRFLFRCTRVLRNEAINSHAWQIDGIALRLSTLNYSHYSKTPGLPSIFTATGLLGNLRLEVLELPGTLSISLFPQLPSHVFVAMRFGEMFVRVARTSSFEREHE